MTEAHPHGPEADPRFTSRTFTPREGANGVDADEAAHAWNTPDLALLGTGRTDPPAFPVDALGSMWGPWCERQAGSRQAPVDYTAAALLAVVGGLLANRRRAYVSEGWREPPLLWTALVGGPSSGKSPAADPVLDLVRDLEREAMMRARPAIEAHAEQVEQSKASKAGWEAGVKEAVKAGEDPPRRPEDADPPPRPVAARIVVSDTTPEALGLLCQAHPGGLLLQRDELSGWLASFGRYTGGDGGERQFWLEAYGGRAYRIDRVKSPDPILIPHLSVGVLGTMQPDKLAAVTGGADDGLAARFLWLWPDPVPGFKVHRETIDDAQRHALRRLFDLPMAEKDGEMYPGPMRLDEGAVDALEAAGQRGSIGR